MTTDDTPAPRRRPWLPRVTPLGLNLLVALFLLAAHNASFWRQAHGIMGESAFTFGIFALAILCLTLLLTALGSLRWLHKPWLVFLILVAAAASFHADRLGVVIDTVMIQNILMTHTAEAVHIITPALILHMLIWGVLPAALVIMVPVRRPGLLRELILWPVSAAIFAGAVVALALVEFAAFASVLRTNRGLMYHYIPATPVNSAVRLTMQSARTVGIEVEPLGRDAAPAGRLAATGRPAVTLVVVGETARAQNWGLNGYERDTTPELRSRGVINFPEAEACGTSTAVALPCMMSVYRRVDYTHARNLGTENLLDVLTHAGLAVEFWGNNAGDYRLTRRIGNFRRMGPQDDAEACVRGECTDAVFVPVLRDFLDRVETDSVIVMHMIGSHGPAYFLRYPPELERFVPACQSVDFRACTREEIVNAYDNTILMTDHVLAQMIDLLEAAQDRVASSLYFVSDHGESLGEGGMYLHGAPWFLAPPEQTQVPMVLWFSEPKRAGLGLSTDCLAAIADQPVSHDHLFHTVLSMADVATEVRDPGLDLVGACQEPAP